MEGNEAKGTTVDELNDIFPALQKYKTNHSLPNFQNLCVEILEFCRAVYASTQNDDERQIYQKIIKKIIE